MEKKTDLRKFLQQNEATAYEMNYFRFLISEMCDRQKLPDYILALLPKELFSVKINWEDMGLFLKKPSQVLSAYMDEHKLTELKGSFFKLSSRSSKDSGLLKFIDLHDLDMIMQDSLRWYDDLFRMKGLKVDTYLYFLEFLEDCHISKEVRVFITNYQVQGITAYNYQFAKYTFSEDFMQKVKAEVEAKILGPLTSKKKDAYEWDLNSFVIDAYERADGSVQFLEVNPYWEADTCCYGSHAKIGDPFFCRNDR